jgi:hypothetical protein
MMILQLIILQELLFGLVLGDHIKEKDRIAIGTYENNAGLDFLNLEEDRKFLWS